MYKKADYPIKLTRGDYFELSFKWKVDGEYVNLDGWDARFQVRKNASSTDAIISLQASEDGITLGSDGGVDVYYPIDNDLPLGVWVYDFEFMPADGKNFTPFAGSFTIERGATN